MATVDEHAVATAWLGGTMLLTMLVCAPFFWKRRALFPHMSLLPGNPQIPLGLARASYVAACVAQLGVLILPLLSGGAREAALLKACLLVHCVWSAVWALVDEAILCPQLVHISAACLALLCDDVRCLELYSVCLYVWGGAQKLNARFIAERRRNFFRPLILRFGADVAAWPPRLVAALNASGALSELTMGVVLLCGDASARRVAALALVALHAVLLLAMSPLGANAYHEVWPWNVLCIALLWTLYLRAPAAPAIPGSARALEAALRGTRLAAAQPLWTRLLAEPSALAAAFALAFGALPALSFVGRWHPQLSFQMHSLNFTSVEMSFEVGRAPRVEEGGAKAEWVQRHVDASGVINVYRAAFAYRTGPPYTRRAGSLWARVVAKELGANVRFVFVARPPLCSLAPAVRRATVYGGGRRARA